MLEFFIIAIAGLLCWFIIVYSMCLLISFASYQYQWRPLLERYRSYQEPSGQVWKVSYLRHAGFELTTNAEGIFIDHLGLDLIHHPTLFVPWQEFHDVVILPRAWFRNGNISDGSTYIEVQMGYPTIKTLSIPIKIFEQTEGRKLLPTSPIETNVPAS